MPFGVPLPPASAPVWDRIGGLAVLAPVFLGLGVAVMRYPAAFVVADNPLLVDGESDVTGIAAAKRQLGGFLVTAFGVAFILGAMVPVWLSPAGLVAVTAAALAVAVLLVVGSGLVAPAFAALPRPGPLGDYTARALAEYCGVCVGLVGAGGGLLVAFAVVAG